LLGAEPLGTLPAYSPLQHWDGRISKRVKCYTLQDDIPSKRRYIVSDEVKPINLLGSDLLAKGWKDVIMDNKMCYYKITRIISAEPQTLEDVLR